SYLEKLDDVGRMEACGMHRETDAADGVDRVHIFARTFNIPQRYFYRWYDVNRNRWSAWERVPVDIEGDHLIPVAWNRRLHLFWPVFVEKPDQFANQQLPKGSDPLTQWEIKMAWSEYRQRRWTAKAISSKAIISSCAEQDASFGNVPLSLFYLPAKAEHFFHAITDGEELAISCRRRFDALAQRALVKVDEPYVSPVTGEVPEWHLVRHEVVGVFSFIGCRGRAEI